jgi:hypothetical protein
MSAIASFFVVLSVASTKGIKSPSAIAALLISLKSKAIVRVWLLAEVSNPADPAMVNV